MGALFCGKCGFKIPIKCVKCGTVGEDDDMFCIKCGRQLPESPFAGEEDEDASKSPKAAAAPKPAPSEPPKPVETPKQAEPPKPEKQEKAPEAPPKPKPEPVQDSGKGWKLSSGKHLLEFYDVFSRKVGFVIEEEAPIDGTAFTLKAFQSKIIIWDDNQSGMKFEGFYKDGKRVSFWVYIQKNGVNDVQHQAGGKDEVVLNQLDAIHTYLEYYNPKLIAAIEKTYKRYCE